MKPKGGKPSNKKRFYKQQFQKQKRADELLTSMAGFMVTCDRNKEKRCIAELMNLLSNTTQELYTNLDTTEEIQSNKKVLLAEDYITAQITSLKNSQLYFLYQTNCDGILFLKVNPKIKDAVDVNKIGMTIIDSIHNTQQAQTKFTYRFLPIQVACKAKFELFKSYCGKYIEDLAKKKTPFSWCLEIRSRNNSSVKREEYLQYLITVIQEPHHIDLYAPEITILIEVINDLMCFSILEAYFSLCKYNLQALTAGYVEAKPKPMIQEKEPMIAEIGQSDLCTEDIAII